MNSTATDGARSKSYDVVICGGGLAGLTLARQLRLKLPALSVAVVERLARPLPEAAHKVGESSVEVGAHYFGHVLGLRDYLDEFHLPKFGLRFFIGDAQGPFEDRCELGQMALPPTPAYQLDRGRLENDLRQMASEQGVTLWEGYSVEDISFGAGDQPHAITVKSDAGQETLTARWVVDALGRRRLIQRKLHLQDDSGHTASAAWWRVEGKIDITNFVPQDDRRWHGRVVESRYLSTNHLMGYGYWVWFIPLGSGCTSVGIVTDETMHPFRTYGTDFQQALEWLKQYEPIAFEATKDRPPMDFLGFRNFSYHSKQAFSADRWSCVGEAALFSDPFYSPGSDYIAISNTITTTLISNYFAGTLKREDVDLCNHVYLDLLAQGTYSIYRGTYATFGHAHVYRTKMFWDATAYWSMWAPMFFQGFFEDFSALKEIQPMAERLNRLGSRMQRMFIDWAGKTPPRPSPGFYDMGLCGSLLPMLHFDLHAKRSKEEFLTAARENLELAEELAQAVFFHAARDCRLPGVEELPAWINAWAIGLDPEAWERDGLTRPTTAPRDLKPMAQHVRLMNGPPQGLERMRVAVQRAFVHAFSGRSFYAFNRFYINRVMRKRSAIGLRRFLFSGLFQSPPAAMPETPRTPEMPALAPRQSNV